MRQGELGRGLAASDLISTIRQLLEEHSTLPEMTLYAEGEDAMYALGARIAGRPAVAA